MEWVKVILFYYYTFDLPTGGDLNFPSEWRGNLEFGCDEAVLNASQVN